MDGSVLEAAGRLYRGEGEEGLVLVEGRHLVEQCLARDGCVVRGVVFVGESHLGLEAKVPDDVPCERIDSRAARAMAGFVFHRGVVAVVERPALACEEGLVERVSGGGVLLVCPATADPGNLGAMVRNAAAFGACGAVLGTGSADAFGRKAIRGSAGAVFGMPPARTGDVPGFLERLRAAGVEVLGAEDGTGSVPAADWEPRADRGVAIVIGNEGEGLSGEVRRRCDGFVSVPTSGAVESLNAACAAAVLLYAVTSKVPRAPALCSP